jgi:hypothetical protein
MSSCLFKELEISRLVSEVAGFDVHPVTDELNLYIRTPFLSSIQNIRLKMLVICCLFHAYWMSLPIHNLNDICRGLHVLKLLMKWPSTSCYVRPRFNIILHRLLLNTLSSVPPLAWEARLQPHHAGKPLILCVCTSVISTYVSFHDICILQGK